MDTMTIYDRKIPVDVKDMHGEVITNFLPFSIRGPKFIQLKSGVILHFFLTKFGSQLDEAPCCPAVSRSFDDGETWSTPLLLRYEGISYDLRIAPIYDEVHNAIVLFGRTRHWKDGCEKEGLLSETDHIEGRAYERYWLSKSFDDGMTWSDYKEITVDGVGETWRIQNSTTPGIGIQLTHQKDPSKNGRLIVPTNRSEMIDGHNEFRAQLLISDDFGETWRVGVLQNILGANESVIVELDDGTLIHNCRNQSGDVENRRIQGYSVDGGESYYESEKVETLFDPICHAGFAKANVDGKEYIFFSAPRSGVRDRIVFGTPLKWGIRECITIYISADGGRTYKPIEQVTPEGVFAAYSMLYVTASGKLLCAWETGVEPVRYSDISYKIYSLKDLCNKYRKV